MAQSAATYEEGSSGEANWLGYAGVLTAAVCWGTSGGLVKLILAAGEISALALAFWRDLTTFVLLLLMLRLLRPDWLRVEWRDLIWLVGLGGSLGTFHVFWNLAVMLNGAAVATVQQAAVPAIVAVAACADLWFRHRGTGAVAVSVFYPAALAGAPCSLALVCGPDHHSDNCAFLRLRFCAGPVGRQRRQYSGHGRDTHRCRLCVFPVG
jgi:hypothetical protein